MSFQVHATATYELEPDEESGRTVANLERVAAYNVTATATNSSTEPITNLNIAVMGPMGVLQMASYAVLHPGQQATIGNITLDWGGGAPFLFTGHLDFTDARGRAWRRASNSTLTEVIDPGAQPPAPSDE